MTQPAFSERQWTRLLTDIGDGRVIPVVGPELLAVGDGGLYRIVAQEVAARFELDTSQLRAAYTFDDVFRLYCRQPDSDPDEVYFAVREIVGSRSWPTPEPLKKLAAITHFDLLVSITFDTLMEQALNEVRFGGANRVRSLAYSRLSEPADLPAEYKPAYEAAESMPGVPAVYHLFGKLNAVRDYALREEDVLQFGHRLQSRDLRPQNLFDLLRARNLMLLGCGFPGWLTRFFLAAAKGEQLFSEGARGLVVDAASSSDEALVFFLERHKTTCYPGGDASAFIDELHKRWTARFKAAPVAAAAPASTEPELPAFQPDAIFISYASEDRAAAQTIREALEGAGLDVWFDQRRLEPGDDFRRKILQNIERCSFFLPVISKNTATVERRFFFLEWNKAVDEAQFRPAGFPFILPVVIDDTPPNAEYLPGAFQERHWQRLGNGTLPDEFVGLMRSRIRDLRRDRRTA
jgi:hypothetical protein